MYYINVFNCDSCLLEVWYNVLNHIAVSSTKLFMLCFISC